MSATLLAQPTVTDQPTFATSEGLRTLLIRLHEAGPGAWHHDADANALMRFAADRYAGLARKYGQEPIDAAAAAFEAMQNSSTRTANDPWAVVTVAVRITLIAEHRAQGLLTSTDRARRPDYSVFHDAQRFSDRTVPLTDYHPALHSPPEPDHPTDGAADTGSWLIEHTTRLLMLLGWSPSLAWTLVEYVCGRLVDLGDRPAAYETLRRDKAMRARFDLSHACWIGLLRLLLGHPTCGGRLRHGLLARLLVGDTLPELLADGELVAAAVTARPDHPQAHDG